MSPERTSGTLLPILVLLVIHHSLALQCHVCSSFDNPSCSSNPKDIEIETCGFSTMSSTANAIIADWSSSTQTSVSAASSTEAGGSSSSQSTKFTTENSASISTQSASGSTESEVTTDTSDHSETFSSTITESSSSSGTENNSTENTSTASVSTTATASTESDSSSTDGSNSTSTTEIFLLKSVRRDIPGTIGPRKGANHVCYKIVYTKNQRKVTERGCYAGTSSGSCAALKENIGPQSWITCVTCIKDGCNSTSTIQLSVTTLFLLLATMFVLVR
ncbi:uncharacterized protein LOC107270733 isoform X2 [Cephus cinctus]|uniref:Uncharacterized protein LOC107270733 isoform X2 n=1 Tax=Cephus cinctus TaxID=211228 RepID=A0AAJ7C490_CEPCN|nr:uncharacterized protein LOC107270733 isoform X2 [Cephus cinctus]